MCKTVLNYVATVCDCFDVDVVSVLGFCWSVYVEVLRSLLGSLLAT